MRVSEREENLFVSAEALTPPLSRGGLGIPQSFSSSPEAPLPGELSAKQTERLYEGQPSRKPLPHSNLFAGITIAPNSEAIYTTSTATHTCQPVTRSTKTAPAVQGGTSTSDTIDQTRNARRTCFQFRLL